MMSPGSFLYSSRSASFFLKYTPMFTKPFANTNTTQSLDYLSNFTVKHNLPAGVKDKAPGLCWAASLSSRSKGLLIYHTDWEMNNCILKMNELLCIRQFGGNGEEEHRTEDLGVYPCVCESKLRVWKLTCIL